MHTTSHKSYVATTNSAMINIQSTSSFVHHLIFFQCLYYNPIKIQFGPKYHQINRGKENPICEGKRLATRAE